MTRRFFGWIVLLGCALALTACGFELRGASNYAFKRLYISSSNGQMAIDISRYIRYGSKDTVVVKNAKDADARLEILGIDQSRTAVSLDSNGEAREYQLDSVFRFQLVTPDGRTIVPLSVIRLSRSVPYNESQSTASEAEAAMLQRDMQKDAVDQIVRRMEAVKAMPTVNSDDN